MSIVNQIPPLNLNPVFILLQDNLYKFRRNKNDVLIQLDSEIQSVDSDIEEVDESIKEVNGGVLITTSEIENLGANTDGCSVGDRNRRKENILKALDKRKSELVNDKKMIQSERDENESFYDQIIGVISDIISNLLRLLKQLIDNILNAITTLEVAITSLAAIPLGAGVAPSTSLSFIATLLQTKVYEPVSDTVSQQERFDEEL